MERSDTITNPPSRHVERRSPKRRFLALLLCVFFAPFHRFYVGKFWSGFLFFLTAGGLGIWWLYDVITIARGRFEDSEGRILGPPREERPRLERKRTPANRDSSEEATAPDRTDEKEHENDWVVETEEGEEVALDDDEIMGDPLEEEFRELEKQYDRQQD